MAIVTREPDTQLSRHEQERCCCCWQPTSFWHAPSDVALCPDCAVLVSPGELPEKRQWCDESRRRRLAGGFMGFNEISAYHGSADHRRAIRNAASYPFR
jgi:hypothetical protein